MYISRYIAVRWCLNLIAALGIVALVGMGISPFARAENSSAGEGERIFPILCVASFGDGARDATFTLDADLIGKKSTKDMGLARGTFRIISKKSKVRLEVKNQASGENLVFDAIAGKSLWIEGGSLDPVTAKEADVATLALRRQISGKNKENEKIEIRLTISRDDAEPILSVIEMNKTQYFSNCYWRTE